MVVEVVRCVQLMRWPCSSCNGRAASYNASRARATAVELVRCLSSRCDGRGAREMAVELERWCWSSCDGGGARRCSCDACSSCNGRGASYEASQACEMHVKSMRRPWSLCDDGRARAMAVELEQWRWSSCDGHQACATMATLMELVRCLWSTLKAMTCYIFSVVSV